MSAPPKFATLADAIAAYLAGRSRRWAEVDGHQVDLHAAAHPCEVSRPPDDERAVVSMPQWIGDDRVAHDYRASRNVEIELSQAVEVLPELAVPSEAALTRVLTEDADGAVYYTTRSGERVKIMEARQPDGERCPWCGHVEATR